MKNIWQSLEYIKEQSKNKTIVFWGRSEDWVHKTIKELSGISIEAIVDINEVYHNTSFYDIPVISPSKLNEIEDDIFIVITGGTYESIIDSISDMNYKKGTEYCCSPVFKDWAILHDMRDYEQNLLIVSSDHTEKEGGKRYSRLGGGLFTFNTSTNKLEKKVDGHFRQIVEVDNLYYVVEYVEKLVYVIDKEYNILHKYKIDQSEKQNEKPNSCGIAYHPKKEQFYIANAGSDVINIYKKQNFQYVDSIHISQKSTQKGGGLHHINDLTIADDSLFVTCFSITGVWKNDFMDGGIFEYDVNNIQKSPNVLINTLWKPHSIEYINNKICYLDSMRGNLHIGNQVVAGYFQGFARALAYDNRFYYVGQSEAMYLKELFHINSNTILNSGIYMFDATNKVSRFYTFPELSNVHDILVINND